MEDWQAWAAIAAEPGMGALIAERDRRFAGVRRDLPNRGSPCTKQRWKTPDSARWA